MTIRFNDDITIESVNELIRELTTHPKVDLFFSTNGGEIISMYSLIHYLNSRKGEVRVFLDYICSSAGAMLFTKYEGNICFTEYFECSYLHRWDMLTYKHRKDDIIDDKWLDKHWHEIWNREVDIWESAGLKRKKVKLLRKNKPCYVYRDEFKKLNFPTSFSFQ